MNTRTRQPLDAEERELADRLARLGSGVEPSSALDARILASSARAAAAGRSPPVQARRSRQRWPMAFGIAATLALAVGVAWQLRPATETQQVYSEVPRAMVTTDSVQQPARAVELPEQAVAAPLPPQPQSPAAELAAGAAAPAGSDASAETAADLAKPAAREQSRSENVSQRTARSAANSPPAPAVEAYQDAAAEAEAASAGAPVAFPAPIEPDAAQRRARPQPTRQQPPASVVHDEPPPVQRAPARMPAPVAAPAPSPPPAPTPLESVSVPDAGAASGAVRAAPTKRPKAESGKLDRIEVTGARIRDNAGFSDDEIDAQPPATADSPSVRGAWLRRIRELIASGEIEAARDNLGEFKRRYPRYALPDDLEALYRNQPLPDPPTDE